MKKIEPKKPYGGEEDVKPVLIRCAVFTIISLIVPILAGTGVFYVPENEPIEVWFQRSGAIMVGLAIHIQSRLSGVYLILSTRLLPNGELQKKYRTPFNICFWLLMLSLTIGTIIWSYGDLILKQFIY